MSAPFNTIDAANRNFEQLFNSGKIDALAELYTVDGRLFPSDKNKYEGRGQVKLFWQGARDVGVDNIRLTTGTVIEAGADRLIETSSYEHSLGRGNYQVVWKRAEAGKNDWRLEIDIFN